MEEENSQALSHFMATRITEEQYEALAHEAKLLGISTAAYVRQLICQRKVKVEIKAVLDASHIRPAVNQLARVGNNLNQIAYQMNSRGCKDPELLEQTRTVLKRVIEATGELLRIAGSMPDRQ